MTDDLIQRLAREAGLEVSPGARDPSPVDGMAWFKDIAAQAGIR